MSSNEAAVSSGELRVSPTGSRRRFPRFQLLAALGATVALVAFFGWRQGRNRDAATATDNGAPRIAGASATSGGQKPAERPVVVQTAAAQLSDVTVVLNGLGSVMAKRSVQLRSRVPGQLLRIHFQEGDLVQAGQLLAELDPRPFQSEVQRAAGQLARDKALLDHARADLIRARALREEAIANQEEVDLKASLVRQYEGTLQIDEGQLSHASLQLSYSRIVAPFAGRIGLRSIDVGNNVTPNDATQIATIHAVQPIDALFTLPEDQLPVVASRLEARAKPGLAVEAWDKGSRHRIATGHLVALDNQVDPNTGTFKLKAQFANDDGLLFPNQFVNIRLVLETRERSVVVPQAAVQYGTVGPYVYTVDKDQVAHVSPVRLGTADGPVIAVEGGLGAGMLVVVSGVDRLRDGSRVLVAGSASETSHASVEPAGSSLVNAEPKSRQP